MHTLSPQHLGLVSGGYCKKSQCHRKPSEPDFLTIIEKKYAETTLSQLMLEISLLAASIALGHVAGAANQDGFLFHDDDDF